MARVSHEARAVLAARAPIRQHARMHGTWILRRPDGGEIRRFRQTYSLVRRPDGWRIFASIIHAPA